ncbi:MAG: transposase [Candidatus Zixiibacteriota bacterium]
MGLRYPNQRHGAWFYVTTTFKNWQHFCAIPGFPERLCESLEFCLAKYDAVLAAYVLMPSHVHLILAIDGNQLGNFMRDFKKYTGRRVAEEFGLPPSIWMPRYDRLVIVSDSVMETKVEYVHKNPVKAGLVKRAIQWKWSSARDYFSDDVGSIPVFAGWR